MTSAVGDSKVFVGIFTPAFSFPASLPHESIVKAVLTELELREDQCEFLKQDKDKLTCVIKNNKFTLQYVQEIYVHNKQILDQLQRAAEALLALNSKLDEDETLIRELREQMSSNNVAWQEKYKEEHNIRMVLQDKLDKLKFVVNSETAESQEPAPKPKIPKLLLTAMNGVHIEPNPVRIEKMQVPPAKTSPHVSPKEQTRFAHNSPRNSPREQSTQTPLNMNGKRSISSSNLHDLHPNGKHSNESSPRTTLSPRNATSPCPTPSPRPSHAHFVKEHVRRHSSNEEAALRRHSNTDIAGLRNKISIETPSHSYFDITQPYSSDTHSIPTTVVHSFSTDSFSKKKSVIVHIKSRSEAQLDLPIDALTKKKQGMSRKIESAPSSPNIARTRNILPCRLCPCTKFHKGTVEWLCGHCNHASVNHSFFVQNIKASPAQSPSVSPRKTNIG